MADFTPTATITPANFWKTIDKIFNDGAADVQELMSNFDPTKAADRRLATDYAKRVVAAMLAVPMEAPVDAAVPADAPAPTAPGSPVPTTTPTGTTPLPPPPLPATRPAATGGFRLSFGKKTTAPAGAPATP